MPRASGKWSPPQCRLTAMLIIGAFLLSPLTRGFIVNSGDQGPSITQKQLGDHP